MGGKAQLFLHLFVLIALFAAGLTAQTADQAWLPESWSFDRPYTSLSRALGLGPLEQSALQELRPAFVGFADTTPRSPVQIRKGETIIGTLEEVRKEFPRLKTPASLAVDGYWLTSIKTSGNTKLIVAGADDRGVLYGAFALLRLLATGQDIKHLNVRSQAAFSIRWVDEWDNLDGSIERGYAGRSILFEGGNIREDLAPVSEYGRLLASIGINGLNVNNVNAAPQLIDAGHLKQIARIADVLRPWGVHLAMSVAIASPQSIGGLATYDPLDPVVKAWWTAKVNEIYTLIPDFAGFTVKADSEGQPGPASFGRTPADAANTLAAALAPHGGVVLYRAFVYNHHLDWHDPKADRARAAYDIFHPLDGQFLPNVIVQTKEGPIDFQAREPVSPLFAGLQKTSQAMEVQITQEYTGQQRHLVYLAPMWKQVLDFDLRANSQSTPVKEILAGKLLHHPQQSAGQSSPTYCERFVTGHDFSRADNPPHGMWALAPAEAPCLGGMIGVAGIGRDRWLSSPLALANLYAFGRLAWDPNLDPAQIGKEWTRQTISNDPQVVSTVERMLMQSWPAYESYTGPLGMQTLTDITGSHYGPNIESSERNGWGQWHDADAKGVGKDRSVATGSGFAAQYPPELAKLYEDPATTPDELLLFFHHVPYTYKLHSGKTVIQHIYDSHYDGAAQAANLLDEWSTLKSKIDPQLYEDVRARLEYQTGHAIVWRDAIVQYFLKLSGIPDEKGRAGHYPGRLEAEDARLTGYRIIDVTPWEDASGGKAVTCPLSESPSKETGLKGTALHGPEMKGTGLSPYIDNAETTRASAHEGMQTCTAEWTYTGAPGRNSIAVQYFDLPGGIARYTLKINGQPAFTWQADTTLPSKRPNGDNSTRHTIPNIDLKPGDVIQIEGLPDGQDPAALDYIEVSASDSDAPVI
jgi:alpha-glucuronidase